MWNLVSCAQDKVPKEEPQVSVAQLYKVGLLGEALARTRLPCHFVGYYVRLE